MASPTQQLDLTIISAKDLRVVNVFSAMDVYAEATLSGDPRTKQRTPTNDNGHKNPSWNTTFKFLIPSNVDHSTLSIHIVLRAEKVLGDRNLGEVHIPIQELHSNPKSLQSTKFITYQVRKPCGNFEGTLNVSYRFSHSRPSPTETSVPPPHFETNPTTAQETSAPEDGAQPQPPPPQFEPTAPAQETSAAPDVAQPHPPLTKLEPNAATVQETSAPVHVAQPHPSAPPVPSKAYDPLSGHHPHHPGGYNYLGYPQPPAGWYGPPPVGLYPPPPATGWYPPPLAGGYPYGVAPPAAQPSQKPKRNSVLGPVALVGVGGMLLANSLGNTIAGFLRADDTGDAGGFQGE